MSDVLLFDLDGTLVDSAPAIALALSGLCAARGGGRVTANAVRPWISLGADALVARALGPLAGDPGTDLAAFRRRLRELPADPASIYPGAADTLAALAATGWRMAVVTNKPAALAQRLLSDLDLLRHFAAVVGGDTAARPKPDPAPVAHALALLGSPAAAWLIGDSDVDAATARACRTRLCLFTGGYAADACAPDDVHARFDRFAQLPALLAPATRAAAA